MQIVGGENLFSFFYDRLGVARKSLGTEVGEETEFYLVNLLTDFLRTNKLVQVAGERIDAEPLAIRLLRGRSDRDGARNLKHLADSTLYMLGFFSESLRRSTVNLRYYAGVGESAYSSLASLADQHSVGAGSVYAELANKFTDCVELISEVREDVRPESDLLAAYEDWLCLGEDRAARKLRGIGVITVPGRETH
jgi:hypothetical protein